MKTLNERIYDAVIEINTPCTLSQLKKHAELLEVPASEISEAIQMLCFENLLYYYIEDGKLYVTADDKKGNSLPGSESNIIAPVSLSPLEQMMMQLMGADAFANMMNRKSAPLSDEPTEYDNNVNSIEFGKSKKHENFNIAFPSNIGGKIEKHIDDESGGVSFEMNFKNSPIEKIQVNVLPRESGDSLDTLKSMIRKVMRQMIDKMGAIGLRTENEAVEYANDTHNAFYLPARGNCCAYVITPEGFINGVFYMDQEQIPSKAVLCSFIEKWIQACEYIGNEQYSELKHLNRPELLKTTVEEISEPFAADIMFNLSDIDEQLGYIKDTFEYSEPQDKATTIIMNARKELASVANRLDQCLIELLDTISYYQEKMKGENVVGYYVSTLGGVLQMVSQLSIDIPAKIRTKMYQTPLDTNENEVKIYTIKEYPKHFQEFCDRILKDGAALSKNEETKMQCEQIYQKVSELFLDTEESEISTLDFKISGTTLLLYLGNEKHVVIPSNIRAIGDNAFRNCDFIESIELNDSLVAIGYGTFADCSNLRDIKAGDVVDNLDESIFEYDIPKNLVVTGYKDSPMHKFCKKQKIKFETIKEDNLDCVFELLEDQYDTLGIFALPKMKGYISTADFEDGELEENEIPEGVTYGTVIEGLENKFSDFASSPIAIVVSGGTVIERDGDGLELIKNIENVLSSEHVHETYFTCKLEKGKVLARYDMLGNGDTTDSPISKYNVVVGTKKAIVLLQAFVSNKFTRRQQDFAIEKWVKAIRLAK